MKKNVESKATPIAQLWNRALRIGLVFSFVSMLITLLSISFEPVRVFSIAYFDCVHTYLPFMGAYVANGFEVEMMKISTMAITLSATGLVSSLMIFGPTPSLVPPINEKKKLYLMFVGLPVLLLLLVPLLTGNVQPGAGPHYTSGDKLFLHLSSFAVGISILSSLITLFIGFIIFMIYLVTAAVTLQLVKGVG